MSSPVKKSPTTPHTHNNPFADGIQLLVGIRKDFRGDMVPTVLNTLLSEGFESFEIGTVCSLKSWVQGDRHASWNNTTEQCCLNAVLGYYDDELVDIIPTIQADGTRAIALLLSLEKEEVQWRSSIIAFNVPTKSSTKHRKNITNTPLRYSKENAVWGGWDCTAIHMSCSINTRPIMWKPSDDGFVQDDGFQFDENPPRNSEPMNHLPVKSIVIPRVKLIFHTNEHRYGIKLKLCRDIRVVRVGHIHQIYAANAYIGKKRKHSE
jgi:hypothetical protein